MQIILKKSQADAFVAEMEELGNKFNNKQFQGNIEDVVKLNCIDGRLDLEFLQPVPELVRIACYTCLVNNLL